MLNLPASVTEAAGILRGAAARSLVALAGRLGARAYDLARQSPRTGDWDARTTSSAEELRAAGTMLRDRSYDLVRNDATARRARMATVARIVGRGLIPVCDDDAWNRLFAAWSRVCYTNNRANFARVQTIAVAAMFDGGESFTRKRWRRPGDRGWDGKPLPVPLQLQVIEADQVDRYKDWRTEDGGRIVQGVEFDPVGRPRAVHLLRCHPGDAMYAPGEAWVSDPIGYEDLAHLYDEDRPGMARGVPWLTPIGRVLRDMNRYEDNELTRKRAESCTVGVVTGGLDDEPDEDDTANRITPAVRDARGRIVERMQPGQFLYTPPGRDIRFHTPTPTQGYREYIQALLHRVASGLSLPYYTVSGDLREANYSSARIGDVDARAWVRPWQEQILVPMLLDPIAQWFTEAAVVSGALPVKEYSVRWTLPAVEEHDREAAARADALEVRFGLAALSDRQAARGQVPAELLDRIRDCNAALDERGIIVDADPRRTTYSGSLQPAVGAESAAGPGRV